MIRDTVAHLRAERAAGLPRRRALLRRLPGEPGLRAGGAAGRRRGGRRGGRAVRHQRRHAARAGSPRSCDDVIDHHRRPGRHPLPQRHRLRGRELAGRRRGRSHARPGDPQRLRRAHRQRRPGLGGREPRAQAGPSGAAQRQPAGGHPDRARGRRRHQRAARVAPAVRRGQRVRAQGRPARLRDQGRPEPLPAPRPGPGRQRHEAAGLGHGRPGEHRAEGRRARLRPLPGQGAGHPGHRAGQGAGVAGVHLRGGRRLVRAAPRRGGRGSPSVVLRGRVVAGHHRLPPGRGGACPRRP